MALWQEHTRSLGECLGHFMVVSPLQYNLCRVPALRAILSAYSHRRSTVLWRYREKGKTAYSKLYRSLSAADIVTISIGSTESLGLGKMARHHRRPQGWRIWPHWFENSSKVCVADKSAARIKAGRFILQRNLRARPRPILAKENILMSLLTWPILKDSMFWTCSPEPVR